MGISSTMAESNRAISWLLAMFEISSPSDRASRMYMAETMKIQTMEPISGTPSTKRAMSNMHTRMARASTR